MFFDFLFSPINQYWALLTLVVGFVSGYIFGREWYIDE